jgi:importin subunit beta-1
MNMQHENDNLKQATLEALGFICEEIDPNVLAAQANNILTAVCKGIKDNNNEIKLVGCVALYNALEFVKANFEKESERNYIMGVLCDAAVGPHPKVRVASLECLVKISSLYYDKLAPYMQKLFNITLEAIKKDEDAIAQQAVEFWCTICEEEIDLNYEAEEAAEFKIEVTRQSQFFIRGALKFLVPMLTESLTKQEDEPDEDTWNVAMAAGTCLSLVANCVADEVVPYVMPFVEQNINSENWKLREAATLAFGAILEGPKQYLSQLISQAIPVLLSHMKDPVMYVKDTTAWTLGRVCQLHPQAIGGGLPNVITVLAESLGENPRVASNVCWAIHNLAVAFEDDVDKSTSPLSPYFTGLMEKLIRVAERDKDDLDENNLRASCFEAINVLIQNGAKDTVPTVAAVVPIFIDKLEKTFQLQIVSNDDKETQSELQSLLCGLLQIIIQKLGDQVANWSDKMMQLFLQLFQIKTTGPVQEEALMAVGAIANAVDFEKYMSHFRPFLLEALTKYEEYQVCAVAVGVVGDISRALTTKLTPYCDEIVAILLKDLQNSMLHRSVKPPILSCFGDIALAIGQEFIKYLGVVMHMLHQACGTTVDVSDYDMVDYLNQLREGIFEAYTGIIQGLRSDNAADHLLPFVPHIVGFCGFVYADSNRTESATRGAIGVLGDIAHALGSKAKQYLQQPFVKNLINESAKSDDPQTRDVAVWAKDVISKIQ